MSFQGTLTGIPEPPLVTTPKKQGNAAPVRNISEGTLLQHAKDCRNRFLRKTLPALVKARKNQTKKLIIYHLAQSVKTPLEILQSFSAETAIKKDRFMSEAAKYNIIKKVPDDRLNEMLIDVLLKGMEETIPDVLLEMTTEAGIDMLKDFGPDEQWLNSLTKDDLIAYAGACNIYLGKLAKTGKKKDIVTAIAKEDLRGKLPKVLQIVCKKGKEDED
jgi:hypothetical protein